MAGRARTEFFRNKVQSNKQQATTLHLLENTENQYHQASSICTNTTKDQGNTSH
jgi:hypothetical protein